MGIIVDADVIIRGETGSFDFRTWSANQADEVFAVAAITVAELWHGVERATVGHRSRRKRYLQSVLSVLPIIPYTGRTAYLHAKLWARLQATGSMIGYYDLLVAATALELDYSVATFNTRHFEAVPGLTTIVPG
ncbi:MAG: PIN domain-containing protein [Planctomycetia bacterium]|nr:PIN domain-containing protein [Planctomycetia bacterium]